MKTQNTIDYDPNYKAPIGEWSLDRKTMKTYFVSYRTDTHGWERLPVVRAKSLAAAIVAASKKLGHISSDSLEISACHKDN